MHGCLASSRDKASPRRGLNLMITVEGAGAANLFQCRRRRNRCFRPYRSSVCDSHSSPRAERATEPGATDYGSLRPRFRIGPASCQIYHARVSFYRRGVTKTSAQPLASAVRSLPWSSDTPTSKVPICPHRDDTQVRAPQAAAWPLHQAGSRFPCSGGSGLPGQR
jgi:hypothetical protein